MNEEDLRVRADITKALAFASGFDQRKPSRAAVEAWACIPEIAGASYQQLEAVIIGHHRGPNRHEYLSVGHMVDALKVVERNARHEIAADVRSARARGWVDSGWDERTPLPADVAARLQEARSEAREVAPALEIASGGVTPDFGIVGAQIGAQR